MAEDLDAGRDDSRVEKDKCEMYRFFERNSVPMNSILNHWTSKEKIIDDIVSGEALRNVQQFPVFLKCCHLTQGSAKSVLPLKSREWVKEHTDELVDWLKAKWDYRPDDYKRAWRKEANKLTDVLVPGFILQSPAQLSFIPELNKRELYEMRVEVIWGRAYLGAMGPCKFFLRGPRPEDAVHVNPVGIQSIGNAHKYLPESVSSGCPAYPAHEEWIIQEGHMACVWALSERVARSMAIDYVRIDVMFTIGKPLECIVNEISLSSGFGLWSHQRYLSRIWAEMYTRKEYRVYGNVKSAKPVYMLQESDLEREVQ